MSGNSSATLARVVSDLGDTFFEVLAGDLTNPDPLGNVVLFDTRSTQLIPEHAIVLGVGLGNPDDITEVLTSLGSHRAAALVVGLPIEARPTLSHAAQEAGVALLGLTPGASWLRLADLLQTILANDDLGEVVTSSIGGVPSGDLFALANAIASLIDAPITIEDRRFRLLAFSGRQDEADSARIQTIIERKVPENYLREDEGRGVFQRLYASDGPIFVESSKVSSDEIPRIAMAIRAGDEILGSIWAAVPGPMTPEHIDVLHDVAPLAALHLLRRRAGADVDRRLRADLIATALEGGRDSQQAIERLGLLHLPLTVIAMDILVTDKKSHLTQLEAERQRLSDALGTHMSSMAPRSEVALLGEITYGLVPVSGNSSQSIEHIKSIAAEFLKRTRSRAAAVIGIGPVVADSVALHDSRLRADRALRVLRSRRQPGEIAFEGDVYMDGLLLDLRDLVRSRGEEISGPLKLLLDYDERRNGKLVDTLRHWLNSFGDVNAAAVAAQVHPNTFRYRLRRLAEVGEVDLENAPDRFSLYLQLRLIDMTRD